MATPAVMTANGTFATVGFGRLSDDCGHSRRRALRSASPNFQTVMPPNECLTAATYSRTSTQFKPEFFCRFRKRRQCTIEWW